MGSIDDRERWEEKGGGTDGYDHGKSKEGRGRKGPYFLSSMYVVIFFEKKIVSATCTYLMFEYEGSSENF